jgi:hypothetical protein
MKMLQRKLNYANVVATLALFVALGGSAYAAAQLPKNSVGAKQLTANAVTTAKLKNAAVTAAKVKNGTITGAKIDLGSLGTVPSATNATNAVNAANATNAASASNAAALGGSPPSAFATSTVVRSATVDVAGVLVPAKSDGIGTGNLGHFGEGFYCIHGLNPAPKTAVASVDLGAEQGSTVATGIGAPGAECQVSIYTYSKAGADQNRPFSVIVH